MVVHRTPLAVQLPHEVDERPAFRSAQSDSALFHKSKIVSAHTSSCGPATSRPRLVRCWTERELFPAPSPSTPLQRAIARVPSARISISPKVPSPDPGSPRRAVSLTIERYSGYGNRVRHTISIDFGLLKLLLILLMATTAAGYVINPTFSQLRRAAGFSCFRGTPIPVMSAEPSDEYKKTWEAFHGQRQRRSSIICPHDGAELSATQGKQPPSDEYKKTWEELPGNSMANERIRHHRVVKMSAAQGRLSMSRGKDYSGPSDEYKKMWKAMRERIQ